MNIDITEYQKSDRRFKLWEVSRGSVVSSVDDPDNIPWYFSHLDGMYSYCQVIIGDDKGAVFHPFAGTDVYLWEFKC